MTFQRIERVQQHCPRTDILPRHGHQLVPLCSSENCKSSNCAPGLGRGHPWTSDRRSRNCGLPSKIGQAVAPTAAAQNSGFDDAHFIARNTAGGSSPSSSEYRPATLGARLFPSTQCNRTVLPSAQRLDGAGGIVDDELEYRPPLTMKRADVVLAGRHPRTSAASYSWPNWSNGHFYDDSGDLVTVVGAPGGARLHPVAWVRHYCEYLAPESPMTRQIDGWRGVPTQRGCGRAAGRWAATAEFDRPACSPELIVGRSWTSRGPDSMLWPQVLPMPTSSSTPGWHRPGSC